MDHSRRLTSTLHLHHSLSNQSTPLNQMHHQHQINQQQQQQQLPTHIMQQQQHKQQQRNFQDNQLIQTHQQHLHQNQLAHQQHQLSSLQNLINRHQQQQQLVASQHHQTKMVGDVEDMIGINFADAALALQTKQQLPQQQQALSLIPSSKLVDNAALLNSLGSHINLMSHPQLTTTTSNQQQQFHPNHNHHHLHQTIHLKQQHSNPNNQFILANGTQLIASNHHQNQINNKPIAQSPNNSTGCISDSCSRSSSSGTSSVSPQPPSQTDSNNLSSGLHHHNQHLHQAHLKQSQSTVHNKSSPSSAGSNQNNNSRKLSTSSTISNNSTSSTSMISATSGTNSSTCSIFELIPELSNDGLNLRWQHEVNSRARLYESINELSVDPRRVIAGDVSLAEMSRYPLPIMARAPLGVSDVTLENWFSELVQSNPHRAIKLTFSTTRAVEPAFRVLARHADSFKGSLILNANILALPSTSNNNQQTGSANNNQQTGKSTSSGKSSKAQQQQQMQQQSANQNQPEGPNQPVDAWTFLMLCRTRFPRSTISIGWCQPESDTLRSQSVGSTIFEMDTSDQLQQQQQPVVVSQLQQHLTSSNLRMTNGQASSNGALHRLHPYQFAGSPAHLAHQRLINANNNNVDQHQSTATTAPSAKYNSNNNHHNQRHLLSSSASLNSSSSGHSSGSSSPTSPTGSQHAGSSASSLSPALKIFRPHHHDPHCASPPPLPPSSQVAGMPQLFFDNHLHHDQHHHHQAAAAAAAAALAAAVAVAASTGNGSNNGQEISSAASSTSSSPAASQIVDMNYQQMPLNLNINEADSSLIQQHKREQTNSLSELAQRIQSYNQRLQLRNQQHQQDHHHHPSSATSVIQNLTNQMNGKQQQSGAGATDLLLRTTQQQQQSLKQNNTLSSGGRKTISGSGSNCNYSNSSSTGNSMHCYTREMIDKMAAIVKEYSLTQPITFPIEARLARNSLVELQRLLYQVGANSSLTIVAQQDDLNSVSVDDLIFIRESFAPNQVLYDLPEQLANSFRQELAAGLL